MGTGLNATTMNRVKELLQQADEAEDDGGTFSLEEIIPPHMMDRKMRRLIKQRLKNGSKTEFSYDEILSALRDVLKLNH